MPDQEGNSGVTGQAKNTGQTNTEAAGPALVPGTNLGFSMMYSLGMIASTLDNFSGKGVVRYLEKLEQRAKLDGWTEEVTLKLLKFKFVGEAYEYFKSDTRLDGLTFHELKDKLIGKFAPIKLPGERQLNLSRCYQRHDEDVSSFCTRLKGLGMQVLQEDLQGADEGEVAGLRKKNQELMLNQFKMGLRKDLLKDMGVLLLREENLTLDKAEELGKLQETTIRMIQGKGANTRVSHVGRGDGCYNCGKPGHMARECRSRKVEQERDTRCFTCNGHGHWARYCPQRRNTEDRGLGGPRPSASGNGRIQQFRETNGGPRRNNTGSLEEHRSSERRFSGDRGYRMENRDIEANRRFGTRRYEGSRERTEVSTGAVKKQNLLNLSQLGGNSRGKNGDDRFRNNGGSSYAQKEGRLTRMIPNIRTVEVVDVPHIVLLMVNGTWCRCLVDTGAAVSLIQKHLIQKGEIDPHEQMDAPLIGITGHRLRTHGTVLVPIGTQEIGYQVRSMMVVCGDELLGDTEVLLGRDFLAANKVEISYGEEPSIKIWGQGLPLMSKKDVDDSSWLRKVGSFDNRRIGDSRFRSSKTRRYIGYKRQPRVYNRPRAISGQERPEREDWHRWCQRTREFYKKESRKNAVQQGNYKEQAYQIEKVAKETTSKEEIKEKGEGRHDIEVQGEVKKEFKRGNKKVTQNWDVIEEIEDTEEPTILQVHEGIKEEKEKLAGPSSLEVNVNIEEFGEVSEDDSDYESYVDGVRPTYPPRKRVQRHPIHEKDVENTEVKEPQERIMVNRSKEEDGNGVKEAEDAMKKVNRMATEVVSVETISIPPRSEVVCLGKLKKQLGGDVVVCEPVEIGTTNAHVACGVVRNEKQIPIRIINLSQQEVKIQKGQQLGIAVKAEEVRPSVAEEVNIAKIDCTNHKWIEDGFELDHLDGKSKDKMYTLLKSYADLFRDEEDELTSVTKVKHSITLEPGAQPICKAPYRIPYKQREVLQQEIDRLLNAKIIRPSFSPWSAPVVLVTKRLPNGEEKIRMCIDYRGLNSVTKREYYPLPNITDLIQGYKAGNMALFSVIDVAEAYHQIDMEEKDIPLTGFSTYQGHYEYTKMPFGLANAPATFQRFMNITLSGLTGELCMVYLDDIIIYNSEGVEDHINKIGKVFERLREANVKLKPKKCSFILKKVKYLGHIITQEGILPDPEKLEAIRAFPIPKNVRGVRAFMGLVNWYRRFIPNIAEVSAPLVRLTQKDVKFEITKDVLHAIDCLKGALTSDSILIFPDFDQPFILATDSSGLGVGAILSQIRNGYERPIAYASRKFKKAELNYTVTEKELVGVIFGVNTFRCYLYGRRFTIVTDHRPLKWILTLKDPSSRLARWVLTLSEYDYEVIHRAGRLNGNADALSRMYNVEDHYIDVSYEEFEEYRKTHEIPTYKKIKIKEGDLFLAPEEWALAHCVSQDLVMGGGIAQKFREVYGGVDTLRKQKKMVGEVAELSLPERNIYYLITKSAYYEKPTYQTLWDALKELKKCCERNGDKQLAIPKIGCGLDKLEWKKVLQMIHYIFYSSDITIVIYCQEAKVPSKINIIQEDVLAEPIWDRGALLSAQKKDTFCKMVFNEMATQDAECSEQYYISKDGLLYRIDQDGGEDRLVVPETFRRRVMEDFHDSPLAGHPGQQRTLLNVKKRFFWPNMRTDVFEYCATCDGCNKRKTSPHQRKVPLQRFTTTCEPWELTSMDIVGPFVTSMNGNRYLLTFQDYFTKYAEAIPLPDQKASTVARAFVENIIVRHGSPKRLLTDQGANFTSTLFKDVCKLLGIKKIQTSSYAPTTNGQIERMHRVLKDMLAQYVADNQRDWDEWIPYVLMAYRGSVHSSTGYSPYFLLHGRDQVLPIDSFIRSGRKRYDYDDNYASELMARLKHVYTQVQQNEERAKDKMIKQYNKNAKEKSFLLGDLVYLRNMSSKVGISKKLCRPWEGPYRIVDIVGPVTYKIRRVGGRDEQVVHVNRLKEYKGREKDERYREEATTSEEEDEEEESEVSDREEDERVERPPLLFPQWISVPGEEEEVEDIKGEDSEEPSEVPERRRRSTRIRRPPNRLNL